MSISFWNFKNCDFETALGLVSGKLQYDYQAGISSSLQTITVTLAKCGIHSRQAIIDYRSLFIWQYNS